jgi:hypothetical protein
MDKLAEQGLTGQAMRPAFAGQFFALSGHVRPPSSRQSDDHVAVALAGAALGAEPVNGADIQSADTCTDRILEISIR